MGKAKDIIVKPIKSDIANQFVKKFHYSGKVTNNSKLHFGVFLDGRLHGVASFGPGIDKRKTIGLVKNTGWNDFLELNRLAFDDYLPKNSESRALSVMFKLLKKNAPHIKWILSYADGSQCGDGSIYRATGFYLTKITPNKSMWKLPDGNVVCHLVFSAGFGGTGKDSVKVKYGKTGEFSSWPSVKYLKHLGAEPIEGFQLRYIFLIDKTCELNVPILDYSEIYSQGAGMYKGSKVKNEIDRKPKTSDDSTK
jgi:hypothetical protein